MLEIVKSDADIQAGNQDKIFAIIDKNPLKHGLKTPGSNIPIISFEEGVALMSDNKKIYNKTFILCMLII